MQDLRSRGVKQVDRLVTDGHDGLLAAIAALFPTTPRQRCLVHKRRNVMSSIPKREQQEVQIDFTGIWKQETKAEALLNLAAFQANEQKRSPEAIHRLREDDAHVLTFSDFPQVMHRYIRPTNASESFFRNVRQRTDQIDTVPAEMRCLTIVFAFALLFSQERSWDTFLGGRGRPALPLPG